jgi:transcriptional regulator with XRE-family HTH domain
VTSELAIPSDDAADLAWMRQLCVTRGAQQIRLAARLSQADIEREIGAAPGAVSAWERAQRSPRGDEALGYARLLRRTEAELACSRAAAPAKPALTFAHDSVEAAHAIGAANHPDNMEVPG